MHFEGLRGELTKSNMNMIPKWNLVRNADHNTWSLHSQWPWWPSVCHFCSPIPPSKVKTRTSTSDQLGLAVDPPRASSGYEPRSCDCRRYLTVRGAFFAPRLRVQLGKSSGTCWWSFWRSSHAWHQNLAKVFRYSTLELHKGESLCIILVM